MRDGIETIDICVITKHQALVDDVLYLINSITKCTQDRIEYSVDPLTQDGFECRTQSGKNFNNLKNVFDTLQVQAKQYLQKQNIYLSFNIRRFESTEQFCHAAEEGEFSMAKDSALEMFILDETEPITNGTSNMEWILERKQRIIDVCMRNSIKTQVSLHSFVIYIERKEFEFSLNYPNGNYHLRLFDNNVTVRRADLLRVIMDHLEQTRFNKLFSRCTGNDIATSALAVELKRYMNNCYGDNWDFYSYTGMVIAVFIDSMVNVKSGNLPNNFTGPNEHSLICGALANWLLFKKAYVIAVTSGMIDEFRGTLANMQRAEAKGFIVCGEAPRDVWFAFQGTIDQDSDGHAVLEGRKLSYVYIESPDEIVLKLEEAFHLFMNCSGPTIIFATQRVLDSNISQEGVIKSSEEISITDIQVNSNADEAVDEALRILNDTHCNVLWQCGAITNSERELVYNISDRGGIALTDSLIHPGSVGGYWKGHKVPNYIGTLSMYGFNSKVYNFLHTNHKLNHKNDQCLFFLKSKIDQSATPFSEGKLSRQLWIAQVNKRADHIAPFTDLAITMPSSIFLQQIAERVKVKPEILEKRKAKLESLYKYSAINPVDNISSLPMTLGYFFGQLRTLVEEMIERDRYHYTGIFDVGRGSISAICNMPRTQPGFSGWYGRAIMGDALMAVPYVSMNTESSILAFVGDGARALVPDMEMHLILTLLKDSNIKNKNVTVFYLMNGFLSLIQNYFDMKFSNWGGKQVVVPSYMNKNHDIKLGSVSVCHRNIIDFDYSLLKEELTAKGRINLFNVALSHSISGDGVTLASEKVWNRQWNIGKEEAKSMT